jgi:hypothetical protein
MSSEDGDLLRLSFTKPLLLVAAPYLPPFTPRWSVPAAGPSLSPSTQCDLFDARKRDRLACAAAPRKSQRDQLEEMFDAIVKEIDERREFLRALEGAGRLRLETVHMVRRAHNSRHN